MARDIVDGLSDEVAVLLARGNSRFVRTLYVAGRKVVDAGRVVGLDIDALEAELTRQTLAGGDLLHGIRPLVGRYQEALTRFYSDKCHMAEEGPRAIADSGACARAPPYLRLKVDGRFVGRDELVDR